MAVVHLVDASPYVFRAYFALPDSITDVEGRPAQAVYGFGNFLLQLLRQEEPTHLGVAFDGSLTTSFRNELYPPYKAQRALPPAELEAQLDACRELAEALGATTWIDDRYEADDLIATACRQLGGRGHGAVVVSGDKDLAQLVSEDVALLDFAKERRYGPADVLERFGVRPDQIPDLIGLAGDAVDNIPGVKGIGTKSAVLLLAAFGHLEELYARLDEVEALGIRGAAGLRRKLEAGRDAALLSKRLGEVAADAPVDVRLNGLRWRGADAARVDALFARLGFGTLRTRIPRFR